jgi:hypothetical protein
MATLIEDLKTLLAPLAAGGAHYGVNSAEPPTYPYIVFSRVASGANADLRGVSPMQNTRVQVDIWSRQISEAVSIETALEAAFMAWATQNTPISSVDLFDMVRAYRISKDYSVWSTN